MIQSKSPGAKLHKLMVLLDNSLRNLKITKPTTKLADFQQGFEGYLQTHPLRKEKGKNLQKGIRVYGFLGFYNNRWAYPLTFE